MWQHRFETTTPLPPEAIWPVIADVARWPEVDANIDRLHIAGPPGPGVVFHLKPRGGPRLRFTIGDFEAPGRYSDICRMPGARMETRHLLLPGPVTTVRVEIAITGPLARFWGWAVGRRHARGLPAQTARILAAASRGRQAA
jgi:hypothetical protein